MGPASLATVIAAWAIALGALIFTLALPAYRRPGRHRALARPARWRARLGLGGGGKHRRPTTPPLHFVGALIRRLGAIIILTIVIVVAVLVTLNWLDSFFVTWAEVGQAIVEMF